MSETTAEIPCPDCFGYTHIEWKQALTCQCGMVNVVPTPLSRHRWNDIMDTTWGRAKEQAR